jgi:hypothetical protein
MDPDVVGRGLSGLGKGLAPAIISRAREMGVPLPVELNDPDTDPPPRLIVDVLRGIAGRFFPLLAGGVNDLT